MRILGFTLLVLGFAVMNWKSMQARDIQWGAVATVMNRMPQQESYERQDLWHGMICVAQDVWSETDWFCFSGAAMFAGGLLVAFAPKKQRRETHTVQQSAGGNAAPPHASP